MNIARTIRKRATLPMLLSFGVCSVLMSADRAAAVDERRLSFYHTHTGKSLDITYARGGEYDANALLEISAFLSDFRSGDAIEMDPELLDLIYDLREAVGSDGTYQVISAYRSPKTNEMLRQKGSGVARKSQHLLGKAIDVRLTGVDTAVLRDAAIELERGGVGYYQKSDFVHIDTGRVRRW